MRVGQPQTNMRHICHLPPSSCGNYILTTCVCDGFHVHVIMIRWMHACQFACVALLSTALQTAHTHMCRASRMRPFVRHCPADKGPIARQQMNMPERFVRACNISSHFKKKITHTCSPDTIYSMKTYICNKCYNLIEFRIKQTTLTLLPNFLFSRIRAQKSHGPNPNRAVGIASKAHTHTHHTRMRRSHSHACSQPASHARNSVFFKEVTGPPACAFRAIRARSLAGVNNIADARTSTHISARSLTSHTLTRQCVLQGGFTDFHPLPIGSTATHHAAQLQLPHKNAAQPQPSSSACGPPCRLRFSVVRRLCFRRIERRRRL